MFTTTDQATIHEHRPTKPAEAEHPARPMHGPASTRQRRTALRWIGGAIVALAAATVALALVVASDTDAPANDVVVTEGDDNDVVELDIRGIPTSWSGEAPAPRS